MKFYIVGGSVRDEIMGVESTDRDYVVVGATEADMLKHGFKKVGADFPVFLNEDGDQFALARKERKTGQGYLGFETTFDTSVTLEDDLRRRDLTVNAIAKDVETGEIIDPFNGREAIKAGILHHISDAFAEDPLRVVRLARFYARWENFDIAFPTACFCQDIVASGEMDAISDERYYLEIQKMFQQAARPSRFFTALYTFQSFGTIKFLTDLWGNADTSINGKVSGNHRVKLLADACMRLPVNLRMPGFVALVAEDAEQKSPAIPTYDKKLTNSIKLLRQTKPTADSIFKLLAFTRGFDEASQQMNDTIRLAGIAESAGLPFDVEAQLLGAATLAARTVTADKYLHLKGAEIGKAMNAERMAKLKFVIGA